MSSSAMPGPWSRTVTSPAWTVTTTIPPGGLHLAALSSRLPMARSSEAGTPTTGDSSMSVTNRTAGRLRCPRATAAAGGLRDEVEPHFLRLRRVLLPARELDQLIDERGHLAELLDDILEQPL